MMYNVSMAHRQFHLTNEERQALQQAEQQTRDARELRHVQGVRLYGSGTPLHTILNLLGCGESTLRAWVSNYQQAGIPGLRNGWDGKNANKLTDEQRADLKQRLHRSRPDEVLPTPQRRDEGPLWTVDDLRLAVQLWYGVTYKDNGSLRNLFRRCGFSYHKVEAVYKSRPSQVDVADFEAELEKK
jgi:transposase